MTDHLPKRSTRARPARKADKRNANLRPDLAYSAPPSESAVLDLSVLAELEQRLGRHKVALFTHMLRVELEKALNVLSSPATTMDAIASQAHSMVSLAGNLGCTELTKRSRELMNALRSGTEGAQDLVAAVTSAVGRADAALAARYPEEAFAAG